MKPAENIVDAMERAAKTAVPSLGRGDMENLYDAFCAEGLRIVRADDNSMIVAGQDAFNRGERWGEIVAAMMNTQGRNDT